ncbi:hypothetical protein DL771_001977 [Monosporascus sp. 5C6A]|nr:hypothetical protein DL771_001977 [Monosporascus sp. 5C6A]
MSARVLTVPAASAPAQTDWGDMAKKTGRQQLELSKINNDFELGELAKSFTKKFRRNIIQKTAELIKKRNEIDSQLLQEALRENLTANDWQPREKLLRRHARLVEREERYIRRQKRKLARLERLYKQSHSTNRAIDHDLIRYLLWRFQRHLGPLMKYHRKIDGDISSSSADSDSEWIDMSEEGSEASGPGNRKESKHGKEVASASESAKTLPKTGNPDIESESTSSEDIALRWNRPRFSRVKPAVLQSSDKESSGSGEAQTLYTPKPGVKDDVEDAAAALEKREQRRRMDDIAKDHILDLHVYDKPARKGRKASTTNRDDDFLMSGAIVTGPVDDVLGKTVPSVTSQGTPLIEESTTDEPLLPSSPTVHTKKARRLESDKPTKPVPIQGPRSQVFTQKRVPRVTPVFAPTISDLMEHAKKSSDGEGRTDASHGPSMGEEGPVSSPNVHSPLRVRKETPIPAPQPWKGLLRSPGVATFQAISPHQSRPSTPSTPSFSRAATMCKDIQLSGGSSPAVQMVDTSRANDGSEPATPGRRSRSKKRVSFAEPPVQDV